MLRWGLILIVVALASAHVALAQQSASYEIGESVLNAGGVPQDSATQLSSASYRISLASLGETLGELALSGTSLALHGSIVGALRPAGEVMNLRFGDKVTLVWDAEYSVGSYTSYRSGIDDLGSTFDCLQDELTTTSVIDNDPLPGASGYFYLVSASNRLGEEGALGEDSSGNPRVGSPVCP